MMSPSYWQFRRTCNTVHKFSLEVIQKRRAALEEKKVRPLPSFSPPPSFPSPILPLLSTVSFPWQERKGEDVLKGTKRKYLDFIDILLEARVGGQQ